MKNFVNGLQSRVLPGVSAVLLSLWLSLVASAEAQSPLKLESASVDLSQPANPIVEVPRTKLLQGEVSKKDATPGARDATTSAGQGSILMSTKADQNTAPLQSETASPAAPSPSAFDLAIDKLKNHIKLTSEDYRALGVGCVGFESVSSARQHDPKVELVYRDSPAEAAGVQDGDVIVHDSDSPQPTRFPTVEEWSISIFKAGTTNEITVVRHGETIPMKFVRMNIEDIKENNIRRSWERTIRDLGDVPDGVYKIPRP